MQESALDIKGKYIEDCNKSLNNIPSPDHEVHHNTLSEAKDISTDKETSLAEDVHSEGEHEVSIQFLKSNTPMLLIITLLGFI